MNKTMNDYILQQRSNIINRYYVYRHIRQSNGTVFYVGKGCGPRAWSIHSRNPHWNHTRNKHGFLVEIVADDLEEKLALDLEVVTIKEYLENGYNLCNKSSGGESPVVTDEVRRKMSITSKGVKKSPQHIAAMSKASLGKQRPDLAGDNNGNADKNTYSFINVETLCTFTGTRFSLCKEYGLSEHLLKGLFLSNKTRKISQGWGRVEHGESVDASIKRLTHFVTSSDYNVFEFMHDKTGEIFIGTKNDLVARRGMKLSLLHGLFCRNPRKYAQGWSLIKEINDGTN